jgi:hypothetical protein
MMIAAAVRPTAALVLRARVRDQGVARRGADALAQAIREPDAKHRSPHRREVQERLAGGGEAVTEDRQPLAPAEPVAEPAAEEPRAAGGCFGKPLDQADHRRPHAQVELEKQRQQRVRHFAADVGEQADDAQDNDVSCQAGPRGRSRVVAHDRNHSSLCRNHRRVNGRCPITGTCAAVRPADAGRLRAQGQGRVCIPRS